jgi:hypothetical protein
MKCPRCNTDWDAHKDPESYNFNWSPEAVEIIVKTHKLNKIITLYKGYINKVVAWQCPNCKCIFDTDPTIAHDNKISIALAVCDKCYTQELFSPEKNIKELIDGYLTTCFTVQYDDLYLALCVKHLEEILNMMKQETIL